MNNAIRQDLAIQVETKSNVRSSLSTRVLALGEILWDVFDESPRLGGAPLNFAVHTNRMGHETILTSAVGDDELGNSARRALRHLGLDTSFIQTTRRFPTGRALVQLGPDGQTRFQIQRPASYDAVVLSDQQVAALARWAPGWMYFGTLFSSTQEGRLTLRQLASALPGVFTVYDLNLRPGCYSPGLVVGLLAQARAVKLNESEMHTVAEFASLPTEVEAFCSGGATRYGWQAAAVTFGERGCAVWVDGRCARVGGVPVKVADTVGAGDAFAAGFVHGLSLGWPPQEIGVFANRIGALVASRPGGIPEWSLEELSSIGARS